MTIDRVKTLCSCKCTAFMYNVKSMRRRCARSRDSLWRFAARTPTESWATAYSSTWRQTAPDSVNADRVQWVTGGHDCIASHAAALSVVLWCIGSLRSTSRVLQPGSASHLLPLAGARAPAALNEGLAAAMIFAREILGGAGLLEGSGCGVAFRERPALGNPCVPKGVRR